MSLVDRLKRLIGPSGSGDGPTSRREGRRLLVALGAVAILLVGLAWLDGLGGRALGEQRIRIAVEGKVRDGLRTLSQPELDARGRPKKKIAVRLEARGHETCQAALSKAVGRDPVFVPAKDAPARLVARCRVDTTGASGLTAMVRIELRLRDLPAGRAAPEVVRAEQQIVGVFALVPPLVAVILALATGRILLAMLAAIFAAAVVAVLGRPDWLGAPLASQLVGLPLDLVRAAWWGARAYVIEPTFAQFKLQIMAFAAALVGMVALITRAGGIQGVLGLLGRVRGSPRITRLSVALMALVLFFDDYANTLVTGNAARPLVDSARVSREKLAYLVDSTAAPVAGLAIISTWIGFEVGLFQTTAESLGLGISGFELFFEALPVRFYCALTLFFLFASILLDRDFGPMLKAERRALSTGRSTSGPAQHETGLEAARPDAGFSPSPWVAALPIFVVISGVMGGILWLGHHTAGVERGLAEGLYAPLSLTHARECFSYASKDEMQGWALLGAGLAGSILALALAVRRRRVVAGRGLARTIGSLGWTWARGAGAISSAVGILVGAWAIQAACDALGTPVVLTAALGSAVDPFWLPLVIFLTAAGIAFATGTSWGTMGILIPAALPVAHALGGAEHPELVYLSAGAVLDGAIFGDHCSPISDTTVMSSLSSGCPHLDHVRTQLPYALTVMVVAALGGYLARAAGAPLAVCYGLSAAALLSVLVGLGRHPAR